MHRHTTGLGCISVGSGHTLFHKPGKTVAHARLPSFISREARDDAILDHAANTWNMMLRCTQRHMAVGGAHNDHHMPWFEDRGCRNCDVCIHIRHRHRSAHVQPGPECRFLSETTSLRPERRELARHLLIDDMFHARIKRPEKRIRWKALALRPDGLVSCRALVARLHSRKLPHHPISRFNQPISGGIDLGSLVQDLPRLWEEPLGANFAAVTVQKSISHLTRDLIQPVRFGLRGVVFPQFDPGVRLVAPLRQETERRTILCGGKHSAGCEVDTDANHIIWNYTALGQHCRYCRLEYFQIIVGILQRPVMSEHNRSTGERLIDHAIRIQVHTTCLFSSSRDIHKHCATRFRTEVNANNILRWRRHSHERLAPYLISLIKENVLKDRTTKKNINKYCIFILSTARNNITINASLQRYLQRCENCNTLNFYCQ